MNNKNEVSRITLEIPKDYHIKLKTIAAVSGKSMREIIIKSIEECFSLLQIPKSDQWIYEPQIVKEIKRRLEESDEETVNWKDVKHKYL